ncbi:TRAP transporter substrate-binding protein [Xanthobacteraceae bacterium Astr-EGSB]|uniref:TRAP transporter substrate-binding protein n=1 Tax=Astrobacterium formosum TaxID=3069710 RepID=UPI0027B1B1C8|nr:TRAP transporter substrate-binding protein [Xanthobacteraceae bacterium Astr-EGSB]
MKSFARVLALAAAVGCLISYPAAAQIREHNFKLATSDPESSAGPMGLKRLVELVQQKSGGKIKMKLFAGSILGNDPQMLASIQGGTIDFGLHGSPTLTGASKQYAVLDLPFVFRSPEEAHKMLDGPMGKKLLATLEEKNVIGLGFWEIGMREITNNRHPITRWEDLKGIKMRVVASPVFLDYFNSLGANAVPMPIAEVYSALETRAIDGEDNPIGNIYTMKFQEVQEYLSIASHVYTSFTLTASKRTWSALNNDERKLIMECAEEAKINQRNIAKDYNSRMLDDLKKTMQVNVVSPAEVARFQEKAKPIYEKFAKTIGEDFVRDWLAGVEQIRSGK